MRTEKQVRPTVQNDSSVIHASSRVLSRDSARDNSMQRFTREILTSHSVVRSKPVVSSPVCSPRGAPNPFLLSEENTTILSNEQLETVNRLQLTHKPFKRPQEKPKLSIKIDPVQ